MATKGWEEVKGILTKIPEDEPIFVLRACDLLAPHLIRQWAQEARYRGVPNRKCDEALRISDEMEEYAKEHGGQRLPD